MARRPRSSETRGMESRAATERPDPESQFQALHYFPRKYWPKGMTCRFIRVSVDGKPDNTRWAQAYHQGWRPLPLDQAPHYAIPNPDGSMPTSGFIRVADQIVCFKPTADIKRDQERVRAKTKEQEDALNDYVRDNPDADIPRFNISGPTETGLAPASAFKD